MMLTDQEFQQRVDQSLDAVFTKLAAASDDYDFDVDMNNGALTVEFEEPRERFVVSPNSPVKQIWVSAHVQSYKFDWKPEAGAFVLPDSGQTLEDLMVSAIQKRIPDFHL
ncbi:iron donor protein CyaY [uncultured Paludibaculum sp.]|uniref:iron donor protein CyaY n=1 Tax=uncultured Paludibaculum sp. TaxID=1765020 RepID=UPI002AAC20B7|nr:iron donor protein CyaY [uncultured Paludibaculum sp.]